MIGSNNVSLKNKFTLKKSWNINKKEFYIDCHRTCYQRCLPLQSTKRSDRMALNIWRGPQLKTKTASRVFDVGAKWYVLFLRRKESTE